MPTMPFYLQGHRPSDILNSYMSSESASDDDSSEWSDATDTTQTRDASRRRRKRERKNGSIERRKAHVLLNPTPRLRQRMEDKVSDNLALLDPTCDEKDCWLHPSPPTRKDGRPKGGITIALYFNNQRYIVNIGIILLLLENRLTPRQTKGIIYYHWNASHRCGNTICMNSRHYTVELDAINSSRNGCMPHFHCPHKERCLRHLKRNILLTRPIRKKIYNCVISTNDFNCDVSEQINAIDEAANCEEDDAFRDFLASLENVEALLAAFATCSNFTPKKKKVIGDLKKIRSDLRNQIARNAGHHT